MYSSVLVNKVVGSEIFKPSCKTLNNRALNDFVLEPRGVGVWKLTCVWAGV